MKKLLFLGAGFLQQFVIKRAHDLGYYVIAIDKNPNAVGYAYADEYACVDIVDCDACLEFAKQKKPDGIMTAATDFGVLATSYVAEKLGLNAISPDVAKIVKNKYLVRKKFHENGVDCVSQVYEIDESTDFESLRDILRFPLMVKPCDGSGSKGASRVDCFEDFKAACEQAIGFSLVKKALAEDFIVGKEYGAETLVVNGKPYVMAIMEKKMTEPPYYAELGHTVPSELSFENKIIDTVKNAVTSLKITTGAVNMDMLISEDGEICIVDVGARMGGNLICSHIIPIGTGIAYMDNVIKTAMGDEVSLEPISVPTPVSTGLLALTPGIVKSLPDFDAISKKYSVEIVHHLAVGDEIRKYRNNLDGCGYVIACGDDINDNKRRVNDAISEIDRSIVRE